MLQRSDNDEKNMHRDLAKPRLETAVLSVESCPSPVLVVLACAAALLIGCESSARPRPARSRPDGIKEIEIVRTVLDGSTVFSKT